MSYLEHLGNSSVGFASDVLHDIDAAATGWERQPLPTTLACITWTIVVCACPAPFLVASIFRLTAAGARRSAHEPAAPPAAG